jgi:hypothetical protein
MAVCHKAPQEGSLSDLASEPLQLMRIGAFRKELLHFLCVIGY